MLSAPVRPAGTDPGDPMASFGFGGLGGLTAAAPLRGPPGPGPDAPDAPAAAAPGGPPGGPDWLGGFGGVPTAPSFGGGFGGTAPAGGPPGGPDRPASFGGGFGGTAPAGGPPGGPDRPASFGGGFGGTAPAGGPPGGPDGLHQQGSFGFGGAPAAAAEAGSPGGTRGPAEPFGFGGVPAAAAPAGPPGGGFGAVPMMGQTSPAAGAMGEGGPFDGGYPFGAAGQNGFTMPGVGPAIAPAYGFKGDVGDPGARRPATGMQGFTAPSLQQDFAGAMAPPTTGGRGFLPAPAQPNASGTCHRCGQAGHWARDCPNAGAGPGAGGAGFGAGGAPLAEGPPCPCGAGPALVRTASTAANAGRQFAKCPRSQGAGDNGCGFFQWMDEAGTAAAPPPAPAADGPPCPCGAGPSLVATARSAANSGRQYAKCPRSENVPGKNGCGYFQWMDEVANGVQPPAPRPPPQEGPPCPCGAGPTQVQAARSAANSGRPYAKCPKSENMPGRNGCGFFQWMDEPQGGASGAGGGAAAQQVQQGPDCPCGAGPTRVRTAKTAANNGRQFASCPNNTPGGGNGCGFFQWMDEAAGGAAGGGGGAPAAAAQQVQPGPACPCGAGPTQILTARSAANSGRQFAKCPRAGRTPGSDNGCGFFQWLDEAQLGAGGGFAPPPGGAPAGGHAGGGFAGAGAGGRAGDECYKCGQTGHWASNCPNVDAAAPKGGGKGRGRKGGGRGRGGRGRKGGGITEPGDFDDHQGFDPY